MVYRGYQAIDLNQYRERYGNVASKIPFIISFVKFLILITPIFARSRASYSYC